MKKIIAILFVSYILLGNISLAQTDDSYQQDGTEVTIGAEASTQYYNSTTCSSYRDSKGCCETRGGWTWEDGDCIEPEIDEEEFEDDYITDYLEEDKTTKEIEACEYKYVPTGNDTCKEKFGTGSASLKLYDTDNGKIVCCSAPQEPSTESVAGMTINPDCLLNGQCKYNIYETLGIRESVRGDGEDPTSVGIFVQDIVLAVTMFIGTVVTVAIVVSGLMRIMAGATGKDPTKAKTGLINALIGLLLVTCSYLIIRVVQYIAKGV